MNLVWFRNDLRLDDNPALYFAMQDQSTPVVAIYLSFAEQWTRYGIGPNQQALVAKAVENLREGLAALNVKLLNLEAGRFADASEVIANVCRQLSVTDLFFNVEYPLDERHRDQQVVTALLGKVDCHRHQGDSLVAPWKIINGQGEGYKVFSAYARRVKAAIDQHPFTVLPVPEKRGKNNYRVAEQCSDWIKKNIQNAQPVLSTVPLPEIAEAKVQTQLQNFCEEGLAEYAEARDFPAISGTSQLSSALALGTLSVRRCYEIARFANANKASAWHNELIWRDFYRAVMWYYPHVCRGKAFNVVDESINWNYSQTELEQWQRAQTGIPIIDAAMRQLVQSGWMHNRLRMVVASYLTKNLLIDWRLGEKFFAQHLFDYDFASNNGGWQWCASVGTDAAPYFRVFNPAAQQKKFDPDAVFIKQWLPELANYSAKSIHRFEVCQLDGYWPPQVDLKLTRKLAIEQFKKGNAAMSV